jgi:hypothetical protein
LPIGENLPKKKKKSWVGFIMVETLLNVEQFFHWKFFLDQDFKIIGEFGHALAIVEKPSTSKDLMKVIYLKFFRPKVQEILNFWKNK